jgi:hypothetical protein
MNPEKRVDYCADAPGRCTHRRTAAIPAQEDRSRPPDANRSGTSVDRLRTDDHIIGYR